ncbi:hypothetical protein M2266_000100 [Streptomyces sp. SPB162]|nr:hypothetical protein [Streptomyces sp. SPB162]
MRHLRRLAPLWVLALLASVLAMGSVPAQAATTSISVDGTQGGRTFDGIGAISGGGGNSRLLTDYPAAQQSQILDYLFKPGYGANLQLLKVEIGGDANSTDGSEPSIEHSRGTVNCDAGYEFWLAEQAAARNPAIGLYGLAWAAPGWINGGFWSTDTVSYLISWLDCAKQHNLTVKYLGGWNERGHDANWFVQLRSALNAHGYAGVQLVADDSGWGVADDMANNAAFNNAVSIIGAHYSCEGGDGGNAHTCSSTTAAKNNGKPLWDSENGSQDMNTGAPALIRAITRGYIDAKMTSYFNWPLLAAIYPNLPYNTVGLATAASPWSGNYAIGASTWATAQVTQFTRPGWKFIDSASGYLGGTESNGTYVTVKSNTGADYSTILETTTSGSSQTVNFTVKGGLSTGTVHVWATNVNNPGSATSFVHTQDITPNNGSYSLTMQPGYVYTVSTLGGQGKGTATAPAAHALALPYGDTFDGYGNGAEARYLSDMQGSFEVQPCAGRSGKCVQQMAPVKPIEWQDDSDSYALIGDPIWSNYTVSSDVYLRGAGTIELLGRGQHAAAAAVPHERLLPADPGHRPVVDREDVHRRLQPHPGHRNDDRAGQRPVAQPVVHVPGLADQCPARRRPVRIGKRRLLPDRASRPGHPGLPHRPVRQPVHHSWNGHRRRWNRPGQLGTQRRQVPGRLHRLDHPGRGRRPLGLQWFACPAVDGRQRCRARSRALPRRDRWGHRQRLAREPVDLQRRREPAVDGRQRDARQPRERPLPRHPRLRHHQRHPTRDLGLQQRIQPEVEFPPVTR